MAQQPGTAPGLVCPIGDPETGQVIYAVPGVPYEMQEMVEGTVLPDLQRRAGVQAVIRSRTLRTWGQSESGLAELLAGRIEELDESGHATIAFLASGIEGLKVRVTAKAADRGRGRRGPRRRGRPGRRRCSATSCSAPTTSRWRRSSWTCCASAGLTLATAESVTGGLIASRLTDVPGCQRGVPRRRSCPTPAR